MRKSSVLLLIAVIAILVAAGAVVLTKNSSSDSSKNQSTTEQTNTTPAQPATNNAATQTPTDTNTAEEATITYSDGNFSPSTLTVKAGTKVSIKNNSSRAIQFDSDPHPAHTTNRELNVETIAAGKSDSFTATKTGTFGYHNHLSPGETGTIIVE